MHQFFRYLIVGFIGLVVDFSAFFILSFFSNVYLSKIISFLVAVSVTYCLHRVFTFQNKSGVVWLFFLGQAKGVVVNLLLFDLGIRVLSSCPYSIYASFMFAAAGTTFFNYAYAKTLVFKKASFPS